VRGFLRFGYFLSLPTHRAENGRFCSLEGAKEADFTAWCGLAAANNVGIKDDKEHHLRWEE
jgi:hypothetical protein